MRCKMEECQSSVDEKCERGNGPLEGTTCTRWYLRAAKLAVAAAIIKSKPAGRTGRQQTEYLATKLDKHDQAWKMRARGLQEEVLRLRQQLLLNQMLSKPSEGSEPGEGAGLVKLLSQDMSLPGTSELQSSDGDSGCDTGNNTEALLPISHPDPLSALLPLQPPAAGPSRQSYLHLPSQGGPWEQTLSQDTHFLQSLSALRRVEGQGLLAVSGDGSVVWDSVIHLLNSVVAACREGRAGAQGPLLVQASQVVSQVLRERGAHHPRPPAQVLGQVEESLKELVGLLLRNNQLNRCPAQERVLDGVLALGGGALLRPRLLLLLLAELTGVAEHLSQACQEDDEGPCRFDAARYENSFYLFWAVEQLATCTVGGGVGPEHRALLDQLRRLAVPLSDEFLLFALYMWRIGGLVTPADANC